MKQIEGWELRGDKVMGGAYRAYRLRREKGKKGTWRKGLEVEGLIERTEGGRGGFEEVDLSTDQPEDIHFIPILF